LIRLEALSRSGGNANVQNRRHFLKTNFFVAAAGLCGAAALSGARRTLAEEAPPETTSLRLPKIPGYTCLAPLDILGDLLREEGFIDVRYVDGVADSAPENIARGVWDFSQDFASTITQLIEAGVPTIMLAGVHPACFELRTRESIRTVVELKGKKLWAYGLWDSGRTMLPVIAASVGLDPAKDLDWVIDPAHDPKDLFAAGEIDGFLTLPPWAQELRAQNVGHVILNSAIDHPWSQYFCCMLIGNVDFVRRNPIATKRVVRAMMRATDICAAKPDWVAQRLVDRGVTPRYDYVRQGLDDVSYRAWRDYDSEDTVRFYALRLREIGLIKSSPDKIIAANTDWRFINQVRKELGI
jgi:NitT/TauT family transport system substrate-binding protein